MSEAARYFKATNVDGYSVIVKAWKHNNRWVTDTMSERGWIEGFYTGLEAATAAISNAIGAPKTDLLEEGWTGYQAESKIMDRLRTNAVNKVTDYLSQSAQSAGRSTAAMPRGLVEISPNEVEAMKVRDLPTHELVAKLSSTVDIASNIGSHVANTTSGLISALDEKARTSIASITATVGEWQAAYTSSGITSQRGDQKQDILSPKR